MEKRKEKLANIRPGGGDKAQEIITAEESRCWCSQKLVVNEKDFTVLHKSSDRQSWSRMEPSSMPN